MSVYLSVAVEPVTAPARTERTVTAELVTGWLDYVGLRLENMSADTSGDDSTVTFAYTEGGYDISLDTGQALESPVVLPTVTVTAYLKQVDGRWLVDRYESSS